MSSNVPFRVVIHGGAFVYLIGDERESLFEESLGTIIRMIYNYVIQSQIDGKNITAVDIVEYSIKLLEDDPLYNAGKGSVFTSTSTHELEASIMDGKTLEIGAASLLRHSKNPISVARLVMEKIDKHNYLAGEAAEELARAHGLPQVDNTYFSTERRLEQLYTTLQDRKDTLAKIEEVNNEVKPEKEAKLGTVGCVAMYNGHIAAGTSTGGMTGKLPGRIGDSPIIGAGTYANDGTCAVSLTGTGEEIMRYQSSYDIAAQMKYAGKALPEAVEYTLFQNMPIDTAGVIAVTKDGNYVMKWNTKGMLRASCGSCGSYEGKAVIGLYDKDIVIDL